MTSRTIAISLPQGRAGLSGPSYPWWLLLGTGVACIAAGVLAGAKPLVLVGLVGVALATTLFVAIPMMVLAGVLLTRASLDANSFLALGGDSLTTKINVGVAIGGGIALLLTLRRIPTPRVVVPYLILLALAVLSFPFSGGVGKTGAIMGIAAPLAIYVTAVRVTTDAARLKQIVTLALVAAIIPVAIGLEQLATGDLVSRPDSYPAVQGTFEFANGYAFFLLTVMALGIVALFEVRSTLLKTALSVGLAGAALCFFLTYTRSAWGVAVVVLLLLAVLQYRSLFLVGAIALAVTVLAFPSILGTVQSRFSDISGDSLAHETSSWSWRMDNWTRMFPYAVKKPVFGHGIASYPALTFEEFGTSARNFAHIDGAAEGVFAHNDYLSLAVELGVPGMLLWLTVLVGLAVLMWRARAITEIRPYASVMFILMVAVIILSAVDNMQAYTAVMYYVMALAGAVAGVAGRAQFQRPDEAES